jgi:hypothetical protein
MPLCPPQRDAAISSHYIEAFKIRQGCTKDKSGPPCFLDKISNGQQRLRSSGCGSDVWVNMKALIFDLDGTLIDTVYAHVLAWQKSFALIE